MSSAKMAWGLVVVLLLVTARPAHAINVEFSAFGDMSLGFTFGDPADATEKALFDQFGTDDDPLSIQRGFGIVGTDFTVLAELTDHLSFLAEVNLQLERGGTSEIGLDMERVFLDYKLMDSFNIQVGQFFTPIGFFNRTLYSRAWLMHSIQVPDLFEEELGLLPTHSIGVNVYGNIPTLGMHSLNYAVSVSNGSGDDPAKVIMARDPSNAKEVTAMLEWVFPQFRDFRIGVSGWYDQIDTYNIAPVALGDTVDVTTLQSAEIREVGFNPHLVLYSKPFNLILEYAYVGFEDRVGNLPDKTTHLEGLLAELSLNLMGGKLHPYIRYDYTNLPDGGGPYYPIREDGGFLTRHFIPEFQAVMVGVSYDLYAYNRIKVEYLRHLDGPRPENGIVIQTAFGF